jgi:HlyD family secretion protein
MGGARASAAIERRTGVMTETADGGTAAGGKASKGAGSRAASAGPTGETGGSMAPDGLPMVVVSRTGAAPTPSSLGMLRGALWKVRFVPLVMAIMMTGGIIGMYFQPPGLKFVFNWFKLTPGGTSSPIAVPVERREPKPSEPQRRVVAGLGKLIPDGDVLVIAPPYGAGDARIATVKVAEGDRVRKGDILAVLDNETALLAIADSARATVAAREAALVQAAASVRASRDEARAALQRAEATSRNAETEMQRVEALYKKGVSTEAAFLQKRTVREEAAREVEKARATLSR